MDNNVWYLCLAYVLGAVLIKGLSGYLLWERLKLRKLQKSFGEKS